MSSLLSGKSAMIACSEMKAPHLAAGIEKMGASVRFLPVMEIREFSEQSLMDTALSRLHEYAWILFTSGYAVRYFLEHLQRRNLDPEICRSIPICAVGPETAAVLKRSGLPAALVPKVYVAEGVLEALSTACGGIQALSGLRFLFPRARVARDFLPMALEKAGAQVEVIACYEAVLPEWDPARIQDIRSHPPDLIVFTSSTTVRNFSALLGQAALEITGGAVVAALGPMTAKTAAELGLRVSITPAENTLASLLAAIEDYFRN
jgi:uroporphyrinogen III methyltransferase/synthase